MPIRTGEQLLQSLRDGHQLFLDGDRVEDVTTDPHFTATAQSLAQLYDMQHARRSSTDIRSGPRPVRPGNAGTSLKIGFIARFRAS